MKCRHCRGKGVRLETITCAWCKGTGVVPGTDKEEIDYENLGDYLYKPTWRPNPYIIQSNEKEPF